MGVRRPGGGLLLGQTTTSTAASQGPGGRSARSAASTGRDDRRSSPWLGAWAYSRDRASAARPCARGRTSGATRTGLPLDAVQAVLSRASFGAMGCVNTVAVDEPRALAEAQYIVMAQIGEIDSVCSRFRPDSELSRVNRSAGAGPILIPSLLEEALGAAIRAAEMTDGLVDLTVGRHVQDTGYTVTFGELPLDGPPLEVRVQGVVGWRAIELDPAAHTIRIPKGVALDLGASGKAWAADRSADAVARSLGVGVLVECGGDVSVRGRIPEGGWPVRIAADSSAPEWQDVVLRDGGLATSGTTSRRWLRGGAEIHDIINPLTGRPAETPWSMVTVAAASCLEANAAATAALIMGEAAQRWLDARKLPSRLVRNDGRIEVAGGWAA
jgi:thiamine biosynthesis lipoprotein ApbE